MEQASQEYTVKIDNIKCDEWEKLLTKFYDSTIYQTWRYGEYQYGRNNLTHLVVKKNNKIVSAIQGRILKVPGFRIGIAHFPWGPMWKNRYETIDTNILQHTLNVIYKEYAINRGLFVRIKSYEQEDDEKKISSLFKAGGFTQSMKHHYQTIRLDLSPSMSELRKNLRPSWRRHLNAADKKNFTVTECKSEEFFRKFITLYNEMYSRKKIVDYNPSMKKYLSIQKGLPENLKMLIINCELEGELIASHAISAMGDTGMYFFGATSDRAIRENLRGAYLLHWRAIQWLKNQGYRWYDLRGYNPKLFPGVSRFKDGFNGNIIRYAEFTAGTNFLSLSAVRLLEGLVNSARKAKNSIKSLRSRLPI